MVCHLLEVVIQIDVQPNENLNSRAQRGEVPTLNATRTSSHWSATHAASHRFEWKKSLNFTSFVLLLCVRPDMLLAQWCLVLYGCFSCILYYKQSQRHYKYLGDFEIWRSWHVRIAVSVKRIERWPKKKKCCSFLPTHCPTVRTEMEHFWVSVVKTSTVPPEKGSGILRPYLLHRFLFTEWNWMQRL